MKAFIQKLVALYAANGKFHTLVVGLEFAVVSFVTGYGGGFPTSKSAWVSIATGAAGAIWGFLKGWLRNNVAAPIHVPITGRKA